MGILFSGAKPFEQIVNNKTFKNNTILYMYIAQGQGQVTPGDKLSLRFSWFFVFFVSKGNPFWLILL